MTLFIRYFVQLLLFATFLPSISGRALFSRDDSTAAKKKLDEVDLKIRNYLQHYTGPDQHQILQQSLFTPAFNMDWSEYWAFKYSMEIHLGFREIPKSLSHYEGSFVSKIPIPDDRTPIRAEYHLLDITNHQQFHVAHSMFSTISSSTIIVLFTTHGYWMLQMNHDYAKDILDGAKAELGRKITHPIQSTQVFKEYITNQFLNNDVNPNSLSCFVKSLIRSQGKATGIWIVSKSESNENNRYPETYDPKTKSPAAIKRLLTAITISIEDSLAGGKLPRIQTIWNPARFPWDYTTDKPENKIYTHWFDVSLAFFYSQEYKKWEMVSMVGPQLGIFTLTDIPNTNSNSGDDDIMNCDGTKPQISMLRLGEMKEVKFTNPVATSGQSGLAVLVLTDVGYWVVFYTPEALSDRPEEILGVFIHLPGWSNVMKHLEAAIQNELVGATNVRFIVLTPTTDKFKHYLVDLLLDVRDEFSGIQSLRAQVPWTVSLIPAGQMSTYKYGENHVFALSTNSNHDFLTFELKYGDKIWFKEEWTKEGIKTIINEMHHQDIRDLYPEPEDQSM